MNHIPQTQALHASKGNPPQYRRPEPGPWSRMARDDHPDHIDTRDAARSFGLVCGLSR